MKERAMYALDKAQDYAIEVIEEESMESSRFSRTEEILNAVCILAKICKIKAHHQIRTQSGLSAHHAHLAKTQM